MQSHYIALWRVRGAIRSHRSDFPLAVMATRDFSVFLGGGGIMCPAPVLR